RFGNPTFRHFYDDVVARSDELHARFFPALREDAERDTPEQRRFKRVARRELKAYFDEAWGNARRIDYGSGMELNFMCWLLILYKLGIFDDAVPATSSSSSSSTASPAPLSQLGPALFLRAFWSYILLMRRIQSTYFLEPAGSHGVWGLDDYHFLPFLLGAAQLSDHQFLRPSSIHSVDVLSPPSKYPQEYMYLSQIALLHSIKTIPSASGTGSAEPSPNSLRWHSPMLDDISSVKSWAQVERGMWKMFEAEVVGKLPVAQHFLFGQVLPFPAVDGEEAEEEEEEAEVEEGACGHVHHAPPPAVAIAPAPDSSSAARVVLDAQGNPLPRPTGHAHHHHHPTLSGSDDTSTIATNTVDAPQQGGTTGWGDCCGIPIPSAYGAAAAAAAAAAEAEAGEKPEKARNPAGAVVAETGQLGRAKGYSASPAALAAAAAAAAGGQGGGASRPAVPAVRPPVPGGGGVRRIPFD
ncbi:Serine/threonine-protein phosphatase 2A activator 2, partial [Tilletia horrida]